MPVCIDVCAATYRRPAMLRELLDSLATLSVSDDITFRIVIVDNDPDGSAKIVVQEFDKFCPVPLIYGCEPRRGISYARNCCLALAQSDWVAFVDDDETVAEDWLQQIVNAATQWHADVVFGPVVPRLPPETPNWIIRGKFFLRPRWPTGTVQTKGATNNVLVSRALLQRAGRGFDPAYNLTGAGDYEFFLCLTDIGARMIFCDEAVVTETVLPSRITLRWLLRRYFSGGQSHARISLPRMPWWQRPIWFVQRFLYVILGAMGAILLLPAGLHWSAKGLLKAAGNCGQLSGPFGWWYQQYKNQ